MEETLIEIFKKIDESKESLNTEIGKINALVTETNQKLDPLMRRVEDLECAFGNLETKVDKLRLQMKEDSTDLEIKMEKLEQHSRHNNLLISGIPTTPNEQIRETVKNLKTELGVPTKDTDIVAAHRLPIAKASKGTNTCD